MENGSLADKFPEIAAQWNSDKNGGLMPEQVSAFSGKSVWWICENGHEWKTAASTRTAHKAGCPYCSGHAVMPGENDLATLYPDVAALWHPTKNGDVRPDSVRAFSNMDVWWMCENGHEWKRSVATSIRVGPVCPYCSGARVAPGFNDFKTLYPAMAAQWHPSKNGDLKPEDVLPGSGRKVWWIDELGHEWSIAVKERVRFQSDCPYCSNRKVLTGFNDLATVHPKIAKQWDYDLNGALTPEMVTRGSRRRVWWRCKAGHVWKTSVNARTRPNGTGCPVCAGKTRRTDIIFGR